MTQRGEELLVQVANLLLRDGAERVDWVKPGVQGLMFSHVGETSVNEDTLVLNEVDLFNEVCPHWQHVDVAIAEVAREQVELLLSLDHVGPARLNPIHNWLQSLLQEVARMETRRYLHSIYKKLQKRPVSD